MEIPSDSRDCGWLRRKICPGSRLSFRLVALSALRVFMLTVIAHMLIALGILVWIAWPVSHDNARWSKAQTEMGEIVKALNNYAREKGGVYPESLDAVGEAFNGKIPLNPFTKAPYVYQPTDGSFTLTCLGRGNKPGGDRLPDKDILFTERGLMPDGDTSRERQ